MSAEFEELMKARDNPSEEAQSTSKCRQSLLGFIHSFYTVVYISMGVVMNESCGFCLSADLVEFTDEEGYGRYLDLHDCYLKYINLKGVEVAIPFLPVSCILLFEILCCNSYYTVPVQRLEYITYLSSFDQLFDIPKDRKNAEYKK